MKIKIQNRDGTVRVEKGATVEWFDDESAAMTAALRGVRENDQVLYSKDDKQTLQGAQEFRAEYNATRVIELPKKKRWGRRNK